ncbi:MAG: hypothetical protein AAF620_01245 [Bacteroidota bacterium]
MKHSLYSTSLWISLTIILPFASLGQNVTIHEYATVNYMAYYHNHKIIYTKINSNYPSPILRMPDGRSDILFSTTSSEPNSKLQFNYLNDVLNYMASFGWTLQQSIQTNLIQRSSTPNFDRSSPDNIDRYSNYLIFVRIKQ